MMNRGTTDDVRVQRSQRDRDESSAAGVTTYTFDGDGNPLTTIAPGAKFSTNSWDGENRFSTVALHSGIVDSFTYNGDGQRVQATDSSGVTNYVSDRTNVLHRIDEKPRMSFRPDRCPARRIW